MTDALRVAPRATPVDHEELRAALGAAWRGLYSVEPSSDAISILLAQSAFETGRWAKCKNWNLAGIKASADVPHTYYPTREVHPRARADREVAASTPFAPCTFAPFDDGGPFADVRYFPSHPMCRFRAFRDLAESASEYIVLLGRGYPGALGRAQEGDAAGFVAALKIHGYFTGSVLEYQKAVEALFDEYRGPCLSSPAEMRAALDRLGFADVPRLQRAAGLGVDGIVGPKTRAAIRARLGQVPLE